MDKSCLAYLLSLLISASDDVQVNLGPGINGSCRVILKLAVYILVMFVKAMLHGPEMRCSVIRVVSGFTSTVKTGSFSFQALQDTNVSWPCLNCDA